MTITLPPEPYELAGSDLADVFDQIIVPSFKPDELVPREEFLDPPSRHQILGLRDDTDELVAIAGASWSFRHQVLLLSYLAVKPGRRGEGHGGRMLAAAIDAWTRLHGQEWTLIIEMEHPAHHEPHETYGDPERRIQFYNRFGVQALPVPYYLPSLTDGQPPVPNLILAAIPGTAGLNGAAILAFLEDEYGMHDTDSPAWSRVTEALTADDLTLVPLDDYATLPVSGDVEDPAGEVAA